MQFAERLVYGMSEAIVYADAEGLIRFWNRGATRLFGYAEYEAIGRSLDLIIPERVRAPLAGISRRCSPGPKRRHANLGRVHDRAVHGRGWGYRHRRDMRTTARFEKLRNLRRQLASLSPKPEPKQSAESQPAASDRSFGTAAR